MGCLSAFDQDVKVQAEKRIGAPVTQPAAKAPWPPPPPPPFAEPSVPFYRAPMPPAPPQETNHGVLNLIVILLVIVIGAVVLVAMVVVVSVLPVVPPPAKEHITETLVSVSGWASCPSTVDAGSHFVCQVHLNNTMNSTMTITGFLVTSSADLYGDKFTYVSSSPGTPFTIPAGQFAAVSITITAPSSVPDDSSVYVTVLNVVVLSS